MGSKIEEMNMEKLIVRVGFPSNIKELRSAYKYNVDVHLAMEFESKIAKAKNFNEVRQLVLQYETIFDKSIYVLHLGRLAEKDLENQKRHKILVGENAEKVELPKNQVIIVNPKSNLRRCLVEAKDLLKAERVADIGVNSSTEEIIVYTSKEFAEENFSLKKKKAKSEKRLEQIDSELGLANVLQYLSPSDLIDICEYPNLGNILAVRLYKDKKLAKGQKINGQNNQNQEDIVTDEMLEEGNVFDWNEFEETIRKYSVYIDLDKMLLLANAVFYNKHGNEFEQFTAEEAGELQDFTKKIERLIDTKKTKVSSPRFVSEIKFKLISESVESLNKHFIHGKYYEYEELNQMIEDITNGLIPLTNISKREYLNTLKLTSEELSILDRNNQDAIQYLIDNDMLQAEEIEEFLGFKRKFTDEQALYYISKGLIQEEKAIELYNNGKITIENLAYVKLNVEDKDFSRLFSPKKLVELYLDPEKAEEFEKYRKLFKLFIVDETRKEQFERADKKDNPKAIKDLERKILTRRKAIGIKILDESDVLLDDEYMYDLYHKGLLPKDTLVDYVGYSAVSKLFASGELKPIDVKRLMEDKILTESMLEEIFKSDELNENQKLILIYSSFSSNDENDAKKRNKFIGYMPERKEHTSEPTGEKRNITDEQQEPKLITTTDPWARWNLILSLDKDYSQEYLRDGYIIFYLPNKSKYIIERLYDKKNKPAYGAATYILDENVFDKNKSEILDNGIINRSVLVALNKKQTQGVKKLVHTGWANALVKYFDVENSKAYTIDEKENIIAKAEIVEKSKEEMFNEI